MKRLILAMTTALCLLLALHLSAAPVAAKDTWTSVRSKNFYLVGNASEKDIRQVATRLEQFREIFTHLFSKLKFNSPVPTTVVVFKSDSSYKPFKPVYQGKVKDVAGYFQPGTDVNYITLTTEQRSEDSYRTIFHEYVHLLLNNNLRTLPLWFNEGLAEFYETFDVEKDGQRAIIGRANANHVYYMREQKLLPLSTLFAVDHKSPQYNENSKLGVFYAESWSLVHYLIMGGNGQRQKQLGQLVDLLGAGVAPDKAVQQALQTDLPTLEKELKKYIGQDKYYELPVNFKDKIDFNSEMQTAPLTEAEAQAYLGDLLLHSNRLDEAATRLQQAIALDANVAMAHASLGMTRMRQRNFASARESLQRAVAANSQNYLAHYYYAFTLSREGMDENNKVMGYSPEASETMRAELRKAIELNPNFAESYSLLGFVNMLKGEQLDESAGLLKRALALAPGNQNFSFILAQIYMHQQNFKAARAVLEPIVGSTSSEPQLRDHAQAFLTQIATYEEQLAAYNAAQSAQSAPAGPNARAADSSATPPVTNETPHLVRRNAVKGTDAAPQAEETSATTSVDPLSYMEDALRKPQTGETRISGTLTRIECNAKGIFFYVKVGEQLLKFHTAAFDKMDISTYTPDVIGDITCGPRPVENTVVLTYLPAKDARLKVDGIATAMEFVPKEFKLKK